jgi:hypothetical protein
MSKIEKVKELHKQTNCSLNECLKAIEYCEVHSDCLPLAYLYAKNIAVKFKGSFDEKVRYETELLKRGSDISE